MRKAQYTVGQIGKSYFKFSITLRNRVGEFAIPADDKSGVLKVGNLFPTLTLTITDEVRDSTSAWSPDKTISFSRFTGARFVERGKKFLEDFKRDDLFMYNKGELLINKKVAAEISFIELGDFERQVRVIPAKHKDAQTGQIFEAIVMMFGNVSNYVIYSYDEFLSLIKFMDTFDYDGLAIKLLNLVITIYGIDYARDGEFIVDSTNVDTVHGINKPKTIPELL